MATIKGERQELKPGLFVISRETANGKALAFFNDTADTQFIISYSFEGEVKPLGTTTPAKGEPGKFAVTVYPQETKEFVEGKWKSFKRGVSFGPPDKAWLQKQVQKHDQQTSNEIEAVRELVKKFPRQDGKYTSDYIAQLCIQHKVPFVDLTFPPRSQSLGREWEPSVGLDMESISWHRPSAWCQNPDAQPQLFVGSIEPNDIDQGILGDCYLMSSFACLAEFPHLIRDVFSAPQNPEVGVYRVIVCKNGWWQTVIVDDYLPTQNGKPCFARNREEPNELWVSLLEKAYAKLHGSYAAIKSGDAAQALADILGAPYVKLVSMPEWQDKEKMFYVLKAADERDDLMTLSTPSKNTIPPANLAGVNNTYESLGLAIDHAYSLLQVKEVQGNKLCMIRNPWGNEKEWNGDWSDESPLWTPSMKAALGFVQANDGTFWMSWADTAKYFTSGSLSYPLRLWPQLRVAANFDEGTPDLIISLQVKETVEIFAGCHQRDPRGLPTGDRDLKHCGMLLAVLAPPKNGGTACDLVAQTHDGTYMSNRDAFVRVTLPASAVPYMVITQCFEAVSKSFSMSLLVSSPQAVERIVFLSPTAPPPKGQRKHYIPPSKFAVSDWSRRAVANFQVRVARREGEGMHLETATADEVPLRMMQPPTPSASPSAALKPSGTTAAASPQAPRHVDPSSASPSTKPVANVISPQSAAPPAPAPLTAVPSMTAAPRIVATGNIKLQLLVLSGRNLVPKDWNGLSDPYVTVKLKTATGERLAIDQRQATRFLPETLNPCWCESFQFNTSSVDVLCIKVWDKDTLGHDAMGELNLCVGEVLKGMSAGGPAKLDWFQLKPPPDDARGELQLGFSWML